MNEERKQKAIQIVQKYLNEKYYVDEKNANIFVLFDINLDDTTENICKVCREIRRIFHDDITYEMPLQYRYAYKIISTTLVPYLPTVNNYETKDTLNYLKKKIEIYQKKLQSKTFFERSQYIQEQTKKYLEQEALYIQNTQNKNEDSLEQKGKLSENSNFKIYESLIKGVILEYRQMKNNNIPIDAYTLFKINRSQTREDLKNNPFLMHIKNAFSLENKDFIKNPSDFKDFNDLCILVSDFYKNITETTFKSSQSIKEEYKYTYIKQYPKSLLTNNEIEKVYLKALQFSLQTNGATKTVLMFTSYFDGDKTIIQNEHFKTFADLSISEVRSIIINYLGLTNDISNRSLVETSLNILITSKLEYIKLNLNITKQDKGLEYLKQALMLYCLTGNGKLFSAGNNDLGRINIINNIHPDLIKFLIGAQLHEELSFLLDDIKNEHQIYKNDEIISEFINSIFNNQPKKSSKGL